MIKSVTQHHILRKNPRSRWVDFKTIHQLDDFNARTSAVNDYVDCRYFADHMPNTLALGNDFPEVLHE